jgi:hypothetical protein
LALFASVLIGIAQGWGESTVLGFLKGFPEDSIGYFASGLGFSGIFGSGLIILLNAANCQDYMIYLLGTPIVVPYFLSFYWLYLQKEKFEFVSE